MTTDRSTWGSYEEELRIEIQDGAEHVIFARFEAYLTRKIYSYGTNAGASDVDVLEANWKEYLQGERKYQEEREAERKKSEKKRAVSREFVQAMGVSTEAISNVPMGWEENLREAPDLTGTIWIATCRGCGRGPETLRLLSGGRLEVPPQYESHYRDLKEASWRQQRNKLCIEIKKVKSANVSFAVYIYATVSADGQSLTSHVVTVGLMRNDSYTDWAWRKAPG